MTNHLTNFFLLELSLVSDIVELLASYEFPKLTAVYTTACHWPLSWSSWIQSTSSNYIYMAPNLYHSPIYVYLSLYGSTALVDLGRFFSFLIYIQSVGLLGRGISRSQGRYLHAEQHKHRKITHTNIQPWNGIRTHDPVVRAGEDVPCLRPRARCDRSHLRLCLPSGLFLSDFTDNSIEYYLWSEVIPGPEMANLLAAWSQIYIRSYLQLRSAVVIIFAPV
jgi:hypothetical protein